MVLVECRYTHVAVTIGPLRRVRLNMRGMAQSYNVRKPEHSLNPLQTNKQRKKPRAARRNGVSVATVTV